MVDGHFPSHMANGAAWLMLMAHGQDGPARPRGRTPGPDKVPARPQAPGPGCHPLTLSLEQRALSHAP